MTEAIGKGAYAQELANIEADKQKEILKLSQSYHGEELAFLTGKVEKLAQEARLRASINTATPTSRSVTQPCERRRRPMSNIRKMRQDSG